MKRCSVLSVVFLAACLTGAAGTFSCGSSDDAKSEGDAGVTDATSADVARSDGGMGGDALPNADAGAAACGFCRYAGETFSAATPGSQRPVALALGATIDVAYPDSLAVRGGASTWAVGPTVTGNASPFFLRLAEAPDGTPWLAIADVDGSLVVAHQGGGADAAAWTKETAVARPVYGTSLAFGSDGLPVVAYAGSAPGGSQGGLTIVRRSGSTWTETLVASSTMFFQSVALAMNGTDPMLVWNDRAAGAVLFAHATSPTSFATEIIDATSGTLSGPDALAIAVDAAGVAHVAYRKNGGGLSSAVTYAVRSGGTWTTSAVTATGPFSELGATGSVRIAIARSGAIAIGSLGSSGLAVSTRSGGTWIPQEIVTRCSDSSDGFDMGFDSTSALAVVHTCAYGKVNFLLAQAPYPAGYAALCHQVATTACTAAGMCPLDAQGKPCVNQRGSGTCIDTPYCADYIALHLCGDATQDPMVIAACRDALPAAVCVLPDAGKSGLELPTVCPRP